MWFWWTYTPPIVWVVAMLVLLVIHEVTIRHRREF